MTQENFANIGCPQSPSGTDIVGRSSRPFPKDQSRSQRLGSTFVHVIQSSWNPENSHRGSGMFMDIDAMKERVRANLRDDAPHNSEDHLQKTGLFQAIAKHWMFERSVLTVILLNVIWQAVDTDINQAEILLMAPTLFQVMEHLFTTFFALEWIIRFLALQRKSDGLRDGWFVFDTALAIPMVVDTWLISLIVLISNVGTDITNFSNTSMLRLARLLRLTRVGRIARLLRAAPELLIMFKGMMAAVRSVCVTLCLLLMNTYIFGILFRQLTARTKVGYLHFDSVGGSMYSLAIHGTLLDDVRDLTDSLIEESLFLGILFFLFVLVAAFTVMNMLIGVLCEVVSAVAAAEKEEYLVRHVKSKVKAIVGELDCDNDSFISKKEFSGILCNEEACRVLQDVGVDVVGLVDCADTLFVDTHGERLERLSFHHFMDVILRLRGSNTATVKDIVEMRKLVRRNHRDILQSLEPLLRSLLPHSTNHLQENPSAPDGQPPFTIPKQNGPDLTASPHTNVEQPRVTEVLDVGSGWHPLMPEPDPPLLPSPENGIGPALGPAVSPTVSSRTGTEMSDDRTSYNSVNKRSITRKPLQTVGARGVDDNMCFAASAKPDPPTDSNNEHIAKLHEINVATLRDLLASVNDTFGAGLSRLEHLHDQLSERLIASCRDGAGAPGVA